MVEYIHSLETNQKRRFVTELYERTILLLGNSFPDWLTRILLRLARNKPLDDGDQKPVYIADSQVKSDPRLKFFLRNFVANTEVVDESTAAEFVDELSRRWVDQFGGEQAEVAPITPPGKTRPMPKNAVFISYCRSDSAGKSAADAQSAFAIRDGLEARGVEVWLDRDQLQGGDDYERKIKRYIETSSLFIPLISETTDARDVGFFRKEWSWAIERLPYFTGSDRQFLIPVVLGPEDWHPLRVPAEFAPMHYVRLSSGQPDSPFLDRIQSLYEQIRGPVR